MIGTMKACITHRNLNPWLTILYIKDSTQGINTLWTQIWLHSWKKWIMMPNNYKGFCCLECILIQIICTMLQTVVTWIQQIVQKLWMLYPRMNQLMVGDFHSLWSALDMTTPSLLLSKMKRLQATTGPLETANNQSKGSSATQLAIRNALSTLMLIFSQITLRTVP